jgi:hypothetical protein
MKRFYTYIIVCLVTLLICQTTFAARVMGVITSENDDMPIRKASVQISGFGSTVSNRNGIYLFKAVPAGHYWLIVKAAGHKTDSILFSVNYKDVQVVNVTMHRTSKEEKSESQKSQKVGKKSEQIAFFRTFRLPVFRTLLQTSLNLIYRIQKPLFFFNVLLPGQVALN